MKNLLALASVLLFISCNKEGERQCSQTPAKTGASVRFTGYAPHEVDTLVVRRFARGGSFTTLLTTQIIARPIPVAFGDTVFVDSSRRPFLVVDDDADVEIEVPAAARMHRISNLQYGGDTATIFWNEESCRSRPFNAMPGRATVDGGPVGRGQYGLQIYLQK